MKENSYPLYLQLKELIKQKILNHNFLSGHKLDSERILASKYHVSRMTIKRSLKALEDEGIIYRIHGKGTFIHQKNITNKIEIGDPSLIGLMQTVEREGRKASTVVTSFLKVEGNKELREAFTEDVVHYYELCRLRFFDNNPFSYQVTYLPYEKYIDAERYDFSSFSLYDYLEIRDNIPTFFNKKLSITPASKDLKEKLHLTNSDYIFLLIYKGYNKNKELVEWTQSYFDPSKVRFSFTTQNLTTGEKRD